MVKQPASINLRKKLPHMETATGRLLIGDGGIVPA